ncbi:MAG: hypothetical protein IPJ97_13220 [Proteobacteria bacterium]|nr:hypothetical protein [Pseudomonadota bacterium]
MLVFVPVTLACLWWVSRGMAILEETKAERAAASGEGADFGTGLTRGPTQL